MKFADKEGGLNNIVKELVDNKGFSKYKIAKLVGVSWNTVSFWHKGVFWPKEEHQKKLEDIYGALHK
jgi:predicted transcriptional regulator